jgi:cyclic pyranopterin phosphate synthase
VDSSRFAPESYRRPALRRWHVNMDIQEPPEDKSGDGWSIKISLTDRCNLRCYYCIQLPQILSKSNNQLTLDRIHRMLEAARRRGVTKVLWTGGEPTVGPVVEAARIAHSLGFVEQGITTNGVLFARYLDDLVASGLTRANISLDSLDNAEFERITGNPRLDRVLESIERSAATLRLTKVNMVVMRSNLNEVPDFVEHVRSIRGKVILKLHEMWRVDPHEMWLREHVEADEILGKLGSLDAVELESGISSTNPGIVYYRVCGVTVGLARRPESHVCNVKACTKIRVYPNGRTCDGRDLLAADGWDDEFREVIANRKSALIENNKQFSG